MTSILGIIASSMKGAPPGAYESIATIAGSGATSINFTSIPSTYTHLQFRFIAQNTDTTNNSPFDMQINGATGTSYSWHQLIGTGGSASTDAGATANWIQFGPLLCPGGSSQDTMSVGIIDIHNYASTTQNKTVRFFGGRERNGIQSQIFLSSGLYQATTAITSVKFLSDNGTNSFSTKSSIALYGIKGV
jgi:hypothetical protein